MQKETNLAVGFTVIVVAMLTLMSSTTMATRAEGARVVSLRSSIIDRTLQENRATVSKQSAFWHIETIDSEGAVGQFTSLALDTLDQPHIGYLDETNADLKYAWLDQAGWHIDTVDADAVRGWNSRRLDFSNRPHFAYGLVDFNTWNDIGLRYAHHNGAVWITETVDAELGVGYSPSLDLDQQDRPQISYGRVRAYTDSDLKYAWFDDTTWHFEIVDDEGAAGWYTSLVLDTADRPRISYFDNAGGTVNYAWRDGSDWYVEKVENGRYTSLVLDTANRPHISYSAGPVRYTYHDGTTWITQTVDTDWGMWPSIALDTDQRPHISYQSGNELRYAYWDGAVWNIMIVDQAGVVGRFSSLCLDTANRPHISYYDETNEDVKYARLVTLDNRIYLPLARRE
jgi:hypothetical protein